MQQPTITNTFPFDADLTDILLTTLPDIHSLEALVLSSKFVYNVFNARRSSVLRAVVSNHLDFAFSPAMRLLKVMMDIDAYWHGWLAPLSAAKLPREEDFRPNGPCAVLTMREARILAVNHDVVQQLESLYSWRYKDPRSSSSQLTPLESERFQMALYRVWFVCAMYGRPAPAHRVGRSKSKRLSDILRDLGREQARFLQSFSPSHIALLLQAWSFLMELANWSVRAEFLPKMNHSSLPEYLVWLGPSTTLRAFQGKLTSVDRKVVPTLRHSYEQFCEVFDVARSSKRPGIKIITSTSDHIQTIVKCRHCSQPTPGALWSESNWSYLRGMVPPSEFFAFLEAPWWNPYIDADSLTEICRSKPYSQLIHDIFLYRSTVYRTWEPAHWLCIGCLQRFLRDNLEAFCRSMEYSE